MFKRKRLILQGEGIQERWQREEKELKLKLILKDAHVCSRILEKKKKPVLIGGIDISFSKEDPNKGWMTLAVVRMSNLKVVYSRSKEVESDVEYIPSYLAFREAPLIIGLLKEMKAERNKFYPDVLMVDGNGILHPRDLGLACHVGIKLNIPCIGVAKSLYTCYGISKDKDYKDKVKALQNKGDTFPLYRSSDHDVIAKCLKSTENTTHPIYISQGHKISLKTAVWIVSKFCRYRVPEPIRMADQISRRMLQENPVHKDDIIQI